MVRGRSAGRGTRHLSRRGFRPGIGRPAALSAGSRRLAHCPAMGAHLLRVACGIEAQRLVNLAVGARHRRQAATEVLAALARGVLRGAHAHRTIRPDRERGESVLQPDETHDRELIAQRHGPRLQCRYGQFVIVARMLAEALADGLVEQRGLLRRVVGTRDALPRVEDGIGKALGELAELLLEHLDRHLVLDDATEHLFLPPGGQARQKFGVAELDAPLVERAAHGRRAVQQQQAAFKGVDVPAELQCRLVLVALVVGQQRGRTLGLLDITGVVAEVVLDDAERTCLRVARVADDDRHVVVVAMDRACCAPAALAGHDLEQAIAFRMWTDQDRLRHAAGRPDPRFEFLHRLRVEVLPVVRPRDDGTEFQCRLHSASLWRVRHGSAQGHVPAQASLVNPLGVGPFRPAHRP